MFFTLYNSLIFARQLFNFYLVYRFYLWYWLYFSPFLHTSYNFIFKKQELKLIEDKKNIVDDDFIIIN
jgi:hypothetical protein